LVHFDTQKDRDNPDSTEQMLPDFHVCINYRRYLFTKVNCGSEPVELNVLKAKLTLDRFNLRVIYLKFKKPVILDTGLPKTTTNLNVVFGDQALC
jgi:hypothetical protein